MIGLIGLGDWGQNILRNLDQLKMLTMACDLDKQKLEKCCLLYPQIQFTQNIEDIISHPNIKGICIAIPSKNRKDIILKALKSKKALFIEKPFADNVEDALEFQSKIEKNNNVVMVGHILHYHPAVLKLKSLILEGVFGEIRSIFTHRLNSSKMRTEKNILWCFAPHDISIIRFLLDAEPIDIEARGTDFTGSNIIDSAHIFMDFPDNIKSHSYVSWINPYKEQKIIIQGTQAMAVLDDIGMDRLMVSKYNLKANPSQSIHFNFNSKESISYEKKEPLRSELEHFIDCVLTGRTPHTSHLEGVKVTKILEFAEKRIYSILSKTDTFINN